ncbi:hypothetical protein SUGI_0883800 [Cryptomeria japonica]|uniref:feruloyl CoA ortho-hydroxylase F6H1-1 isoform X2 n=1 Tax=Cryptomeria japonica TaxID=3369 RepID=UPI002414B79F|nr:feruloyl CoA ortho-hydroxylase F6H1-1 isoform X2 [Cryptomeria japonica]GLJ42643.1 hypothetical protein SUGI_0883800 [Cryptomeria japonica]
MAALANRSVKSLVDTGMREIPKSYIRSENERSKTTAVCTESIPVIDLSGIYGPNRTEAINAISKACEEWGFFQVINHGVPERVIENMMRAHHMFFELPEVEKAKYKAERHDKPVVYGTSFTAKDQKVLEWRDFLMFIVEGTIDAQTLKDWPPIIRDSALEYMTEVRKVALEILSALSESLGISGIFESIMGHERLLLNYYPPCPNPDMTFGVSEHSDVGLITVLLQDDVGGLQVSHNGQWVAVQPISNALLINVADVLQVLSNGKFQSVEHRAVPNYSQARISVPLFCAPARSTIIKPVPELVNEHNPSKYRPFTFGDYLTYFHSRSHSGKADNLAYARLE